MYCPMCGCKVSDGARFCPQCGCAMPTAAGAGPGPELTPTPSPGPTTPPAPDPTPGQQPHAKGRGTLLRVVGVVAVVLLLALGACALVSVLGGDASDDAQDEAAGDEDDVVTQVAYYRDEAETVVASTTRVVLWDDDGEALEDYDLTLMDDEGAVTTYHVDGASFTSEELGIPDGHYAMIAQDPQTNDVYTVPSVSFEDAGSASDAAADDADGSDETSDSDSGDDSGSAVPDEVIFRPDPDETEEDDASSSLQAAYALYYARVLELQGTSGVGTLDDAGEYISGVSIVALVDLTGDGDGIDELIIVYEDGDGELSAEVWTYDAEANDIDLVCEEPLGDTDDAEMLTAYGHEDAATALVWSHWPYEDDTVAFESHYVFLEDGELVHHVIAYVVDYAADEVSYTFDGETIDEEGYFDAFDSVAPVYEDVTWGRSWCVGVYDAEEWATYVSDDGVYATYDPTDTLAMTEDTIELLAQGMMGRLDDEDETDADETDEAEAGAEDASDATSDLERYAEVLDAIYDGITSGWDGYDYDTAPISYLWWSSYVTGNEIDSLGEAGYAFVDLDGDGVNELVVAVFQGTGWFSYPYDVYTYENGEVVHLEELGERYGFTLLSNGLIYEWASGGASTTYYSLWELVGGELQLVEAVTYDSDANATNPYFYSTTSTDASQMENVSSDEADAIMDAWFAENEELELTYTYFTDYER